MPSILTYLLLQAPAEVASADVVQEVEVNVLQLLMEGGWYIMIPLALMSLIGMYVFFERFLAIRKADKVSPDFMQKLKDYISQGNLSSARNLCADSNTPVARMLDKESAASASHSKTSAWQSKTWASWKFTGWKKT